MRIGLLIYVGFEYELASNPHSMDAFPAISAIVGTSAREKGIQLSPSYWEHWRAEILRDLREETIGNPLLTCPHDELDVVLMVSPVYPAPEVHEVCSPRE